MKCDINIIKEFIISYFPDDKEYICNMQLTYNIDGDTKYYFNKLECVLEINRNFGKNGRVLIYTDSLRPPRLQNFSNCYHIDYVTFESYIRNYKLTKLI